ncbi:hypothetical protein [Oceaniglobus trochenteri]|uniref:hypothetical protein n=1 Tax=Oceaniglobus trochenteri TaxID=2763260 RepID=UPI001CFFAB51|nr:hypothetical protein [Oceaniglobus trochenteri]
MHFPSLKAFTATGAAALGKGPIALILAEDLVEVESTLRHHVARGFGAIVLFAPPECTLPPDLAETVLRVDYNTRIPDAVLPAVNAVIEMAPGRWLYYCFNAEYLFHPFSETRSVNEMLIFHGEERRDAMLTYVIDLYAGDLTVHPDAVAPGDAWLDKSGYYAQARGNPDDGWRPMERQLDFFGGLRWRFEEHIPWKKRKIDRISLFRARPGLRLRADHTLNDDEMNTFACPWHNNLTATVCSFRTAKALRTNPGSRHEIDNFRWRNSVPFTWQSQQLLDLGLMEPGQWF